MQILQWLFKIAAQEPPKIVSNSTPITQKQDQDIKSKDIVRRRHHKRVEKSELYCENLSLFCFLQRKDVSRPFFYHTLNLKRPGSLHRRRHSVNSAKMTKEEVARGLRVSNGADSATHVGNKVLPIPDSTQSSSGKNQCPDSNEKDKRRGEKTKTTSWMKELMKWDASAKSQKGGKHGIGRKVLSFKNRSALKSIRDDDDDQLSNESPKISFRWDMESGSAASSVYSAIYAVSKASSSLKNDQIQSEDTSDSATTSPVRNQCADGTGSWITTDSEFVVLEL